MIDDEQIRARAYALWEQAGRPERPAEDFWHQAREQLRGESGTDDDNAESFSGGIESSVAPPGPNRAAD